jgi:long-subunit fatty acid transport protein
VEWTERLGSYYEIFTGKGTDTGDRWAVSFDTGVTYVLVENVQLDAGINIGITDAADDYQPFIGATYRF